MQLKRAHLIAGAATALIMASPVFAQPARAAQAYTQKTLPLNAALKQFAGKAGLQIMFSDSEVRGKYAPALNGRYTADEALDRLLTGSGLVHKTVRGKVVVIQRAAMISAAVNARETARQAPRMASEPDYAEAGPVAASVGIEEIVVTAQKREQNLQDVPIAISAISTAFLEKREITSIGSLTSLAPNLKVESAAGNRTTSIISIRGGAYGIARTIHPAAQAAEAPVV